MRRMTSLALFAGLWVLAFGVASCSKPDDNSSPSSIQSQGDPRDYIPSEMTAVIWIDWAGALKNANIPPEDQKKYMDLFQRGDQEAYDLLQALQVDLFKDIDSVAICSDLDQESPDGGKGAFVIKTRLALDKLAKSLPKVMAEEVAVAPFAEGDLKGFHFTSPSDPTADSVYMIQQDGLLIGAASPEILNATQTAKATKTTAFNTGPLSEALSLNDPATLFTVAIDGSKLPTDTVSPIPGLEDLKFMLVSGTYTADVLGLSLTARFNDPAKAQPLSMQIQGLLGLMAMDAEAAPILQKIQVASEEADIKITASFTEAELKQIMEKVSQSAAPSQPAE